MPGFKEAAVGSPTSLLPTYRWQLPALSLSLLMTPKGTKRNCVVLWGRGWVIESALHPIQFSGSDLALISLSRGYLLKVREDLLAHLGSALWLHRYQKHG